VDLSSESAAFRDRPNRRGESRWAQVAGFQWLLMSWNYDHEGQEPPFAGQKPQYTHVLDRFSGFDQYAKIFQPLLMMECWAQIVKSKDEPVGSYACTVHDRGDADGWIDVDLSIANKPKEWSLVETDVVLLRERGGNKSVLCKTQGYRICQNAECVATVRCVSGCDPGLSNGTEWMISKVFR